MRPFMAGGNRPGSYSCSSAKHSTVKGSGGDQPSHSTRTRHTAPPSGAGLAAPYSCQQSNIRSLRSLPGMPCALSWAAR